MYAGLARLICGIIVAYIVCRSRMQDFIVWIKSVKETWKNAAYRICSVCSS